MDPLTLYALGQAGSTAVQGISGAYAANQQRVAARDQLRAAGRAQGAITGAYDKAQGYQQPYLQAGQEGLKRMMSGDFNTQVPGEAQMPGEYQPGQFNYNQYQDPGTQFRMQQGTEAINTAAGGQGSRLSGATLKALAKFGQNLGSQEYGAAYGRFNQDQNRNLQGYQTNLGRANDIWGQNKDIYTMGNQQQTQRYGRATDLGQMGQGAANNMSDMATAYGGDLAGLYGVQGQIQAQGRLAPAQTYMTTAQNIYNTLADRNSLQGLSGGGGGTSYSRVATARNGERML
jgi:hypothetical protein